MSIALRVARTEDCDAIVDVFLACWRESYVGVLSPEAIEAMTDARAVALWKRALEDKLAKVVVAEVDGAVLGITKYAIACGAGEDANLGVGSGAVHSLYVSPRARGLGLGTLLLESAHDALAAEGSRSVTLWVFAANSQSIEFYRRRGWVPDGVERTQSEFGATESRLRKGTLSEPKAVSVSEDHGEEAGQ